MKLAIIPVLLLCLCLQACGKDDNTTPQDPPTTEPTPTPVPDPTPTPVPPGQWYKPQPMTKFQVLDSDDGDYVDQLSPETKIVVIESIPSGDRFHLVPLRMRNQRAIPRFAEEVKEKIEALHAAGVIVQCYQSLSIEPWRADIEQFPEACIGDKMDDWDEWWTDTRVSTCSAAHDFWDRRYRMLKEFGCDGVEDDNTVDPEDNATGFPYSRADASGFIKRRAAYAHSLGMYYIYKNNPSVSDIMAPHGDGVMIEGAAKYNERGPYQPWIDGGKFVGSIEYSSSGCKPWKGAEVQYHSGGDYFEGKYKSCN